LRTAGLAKATRCRIAGFFVEPFTASVDHGRLLLRGCSPAIYVGRQTLAGFVRSCAFGFVFDVARRGAGARETVRVLFWIACWRMVGSADACACNCGPR